MVDSVMPRLHMHGGRCVPGEHIARFYQDDSELLGGLVSYAGEALEGGESIIVIATPEHLRGLRYRLLASGVDLGLAMAQDRYLTFDAQVALSTFLRNEMPDQQLFEDFVTTLLRRAQVNGRGVRVYGEMVALLLARGLAKATIQLEHLWTQFCENNGIAMLCGYQMTGFNRISAQSRASLYAIHTKLIAP
jgi:hypothetical protein